MDVQIGKRKFVLEQTWGEYKAFDEACEAAGEDGKVLLELEIAQVEKCLKTVDGHAPNGQGLDDLQWNEVTGLITRLHNPMADLANRLPFPKGGESQT